MRPQRHTSDRALARRVCAGSIEALEQLFREHSDELYRTALGVTGDDADAQDVIQDVFVGLPRALRSFEGRGPLAGWLKRVAVRHALMYVRARNRRREHPIEGFPAGCSSAPTTTVAVRRAVEALSPTLRSVFVLKVVEGYSHPEVAELLDITEEASRTRLARARAILRKKLGN